MARKAQMTRDRRIAAEKRRLVAFYQDMDEAKKGIAAGLVERAAFMRVQCEDLERDLNENGWTEPFAQGNQDPYDRARPQGQTYHTLNANYQKIVKQLDAMLPRDTGQKPETDGFDEFVGGRDEV